MPLPSSRGALNFGPCTQQRRVTVRPHSRSFRRRAVVFRVRPARRVSARRSERSCAACCKHRSEGARPDRHVRQAALHYIHRRLCAHSRSKIVGCNRCLDLCPTGAITPAGNHVAIDRHICAGCGQCAAVCPTGAAAYALPPRHTDAQAARATDDLSRSRRQERRRAPAR